MYIRHYLYLLVVFAVNKPASIPVHSCGSFRYNTLEMIIRKELKIDEWIWVVFIILSII